MDGTGNPWYVADVAVKDGRIAAIGRELQARGARTIDAAGKIVSPGLIDIHSHSDRGLGDPALKANLNMPGPTSSSSTSRRLPITPRSRSRTSTRPGFPDVLVNGVSVVDRGKFTNATPGKVLTPASDGSRTEARP